MIVKTMSLKKNELYYDIGAYNVYTVCLKFGYCKIFHRTNIKYYAAPILNVTLHQYQNRVYAPEEKADLIV